MSKFATDIARYKEKLGLRINCQGSLSEYPSFY